ncbi:hypothetical protein ACOME3_005555 [Neoechinorhynchus agilis]
MFGRGRSDQVKDDSVMYVETVWMIVIHSIVKGNGKDLAVSDCKDAATFTPTSTSNQLTLHHWREGGISTYAKCIYCGKWCSSSECLAGLRCEWCNVTVHSECLRIMKRVGEKSPACDFGRLSKILIPPTAISLPRISLSRESIFLIKDSDQSMQILDPFSNEVSLSSGDVSQSKCRNSVGFSKTSDGDEDFDCGKLFTIKMFEH